MQISRYFLLFSLIATCTQADELVKSKAQLKKERKEQRAQEKKQSKAEKKNKYIHSMNFDELKETKIRYVQEGNIDAALRCLEKMKPICNDLAELHDTMFEYAELLYKTDDCEKAGTLYTEFVKLYPSSKKTEYAYYQSILCSFKQMRDAERDQTKTLETIELAKNFLEREMVFTEYATSVRKILAQSRERLFESEARIFEFYLSRGNLKSASKHLDTMKKDFSTILIEAPPRIIELEIKYAQIQNNKTMLEEKRAELATKFPERTMTLAQATKPKRTMLSRF